jgi:hypothetical protein
MGFATVTLISDGSVPLETVPLKCFDNFLTGTRLLPRGIDILDTDEPLTTMVASFEEARHGGQ